MRLDYKLRFRDSMDFYRQMQAWKMSSRYQQEVTRNHYNQLSRRHAQNLGLYYRLAVVYGLVYFDTPSGLLH